MSEHTIDPRYSIGIAEMDREHARLLALVERFRLAVEVELADEERIAAAHEALTAMLEYTRVHFASEEKLMASYQYPDLAAHQAKHRGLIAAVQKMLDEVIEHKRASAPVKLNLFFTVWLLEHIMTEDWKYSRFILAQRAKG